MKIKIYEKFPEDAKKIREEVFIREQGFQNEMDETDDVAAHFVLFDENDVPAATCRVFWNETMDSYTLGRLAVMKKYRGQNMGAALVKEAEAYVKKKGGKDIILHAQCRVADFYKKIGFEEFGEIGDDEGCPHIWMKKSV